MPGYTAASQVVQWFWECVRELDKQDLALLVQFVTGTSKVPLEGFKALQGVHGPQKFQIHRAYGHTDRLPSGEPRQRGESRGGTAALATLKESRSPGMPPALACLQPCGHASSPPCPLPLLLPAAHTCFNQLDLLEYESRAQLKERLLTAIHEGSEGFGFA